MDLMLIKEVAMDYCLTCGRKITEMDYEIHNGVCWECPRLTTIAPEFWKVISHLAARGDLDAQSTMEKYG